MPLNQNWMERFWDKVKIGTPDDCWIWTGGKSTFGHGRFKIDGKLVSTHRFSYMLANGEIPQNMMICHKCDNPSCVNPAHLYAGTGKDNARDCHSKGRFPTVKGSSVKASKLKEPQVKEIKRLILEGWSNIDISKIYSVHDTNISQIRLNKIWAHLSI